MTINDTQDEIIAEFSDFDDWMDRYQLLIDLGSEQQPLDERYKTDQNLIEGCPCSSAYCPATRPTKSSRPTSTSSTASACASTSRPPAATACSPW